MKNFNVQMSGTTGAGKTNLVKYLLRRTPRFLVFDPLEEYYDLNARVIMAFRPAADYILRNHSNPNMRLVFQGDQSAIWENLGEYDDKILESFRAVLRLFLYAAYYHAIGNAGLVLEESHFYVMPDTRREPWPEIRSLYRFAGRRTSISSINIVQSHTDIAPEIRQGAAVYVAMQNTDPPATLVRQFGSQLAELETLERETSPVYGRHYLTIPPNVDLVKQWLTVNGGKYEKAPNSPSNAGSNSGPKNSEDNQSGGSLREPTRLGNPSAENPDHATELPELDESPVANSY